MPIDQLRNSFGPEKTGPERETGRSGMPPELPLTLVVTVIALAVVGVVVAAGVVFGQAGDLVVGIIGFVLLVLGLLWRILGGRTTRRRHHAVLEQSHTG